MWFWLVAIMSQAPVESAFSKLKKIVTKFRKRLTQANVDKLMTILLNGPRSMAGRKAEFSEKEYYEVAFRLFCTKKARRLATAQHVSAPGGYDNEYKFGTSFEHTAVAKKIVSESAAECEANQTKRSGVDPTTVSDYAIGSGVVVTSEHVWIQCKAAYDEDETTRRACYVEQGARTPQVGDEIAMTGFGGKCWWAGKIFAMHPAKGKARGGEPRYVAEVYYAESVSKTEQVLSRATYGPAQCKIGAVRVGSSIVKDSYTAGWVFLAPLAAAPRLADGGAE